MIVCRADRRLEVVPENSFPHPERPYETISVRFADDPSRDAAWNGWASSSTGPGSGGSTECCSWSTCWPT